MGKVDRGGRRCSLRMDALGIHVPLAEGLESRNGLYAQPWSSAIVRMVSEMGRTLGEAERGVDTGEVLHDVPVYNCSFTHENERDAPPLQRLLLRP